MSEHAHNPGPSREDAKNARRRRAVANECIDALCRGETADARRLARENSAECPGLAEEIRALRNAVSGLSIAPSSPDFTNSVLDRVDASRGFLPRRARRRLSLSRVALACGVVLAASGVALYHRVFPQAPDPAPLNMIAEAMPTDAARAREAVAGTFGDLEDRLASSIESMLAAPSGDLYALTPSASGTSALALGDTSRFDVAPERPVSVEWRADGATGFALLPFPDPHRAMPAPSGATAWAPMKMFELLSSRPATASVLKRRPQFPLAEPWPVVEDRDGQAEKPGASEDR